MPFRKSPSMTPTVIVRKKRPTSSPALASTPPAPREPRLQTSPPQSTAPAPSGKKPPVPPPQAKASTPSQVQPPPDNPPQPSTLPLQPDPDQPSRRQRQWQEREALLAVLRERWPQTFPADFRLVRPFALGIHQEILQALPETDPYLIRHTIHFYQRRGRGAYWQAIVKGGPRYALDGTPTGEVTARDQAYAQEQLAAMAAWWKAKSAGRPRTETPSVSQEAAVVGEGGLAVVEHRSTPCT